MVQPPDPRFRLANERTLLSWMRVALALVAAGTTAGTVAEFLGIPYAAPPAGPLRWRPPQPAAHWSGVRDATKTSLLACFSVASNSFYGDENRKRRRLRKSFSARHESFRAHQIGDRGRARGLNPADLIWLLRRARLRQRAPPGGTP